MIAPHDLATPDKSISALMDHSYTNNITHPLTLTRDRYIVGDRFHDGVKNHSGHKKATCKFHNMRLCPELTQYQSVVSEVINAKIKSVRLQSSSQQNVHHYYFYNRLMDYWHNLDIVQKQILQLKKHEQESEVIVRDSLQRFVYMVEQQKQ